MLKKVTLKITNYIKKNSDIKNPDDLDRIDYALQAILGDLIKFMILSAIFLSLGKIKYFIFSAIIFISIRIFMGGYHCKTFMGCLLSSLILFLLTAFMGPKISMLNSYVYYILSILSILIAIIYAPFPNIKRPVKDKKRRQNLKLISIFFLVIWTSILCFKLNDSSYINCGFLTILFESIQIFVILILKGDKINEKAL